MYTQVSLIAHSTQGVRREPDTDPNPNPNFEEGLVGKKTHPHFFIKYGSGLVKGKVTLKP